MIKIYLFIAAVLGNSVFAGPHTVGNGGDPLEIRFKEIALNISGWIESGNADQIELPGNIPLEKYKTSMLAALGDYNIEFSTDTILVNGAEKTCVNMRRKGANEIRCNVERFRAVVEGNADDLYRLVHHEFAGLCGWEESRGAESDYRISRQLSTFLTEETVRRLPVGPAIRHEFRCFAETEGQVKNQKVQLRPISPSETYMVEGNLLNLHILGYIWETRRGFDLQVSKAPYFLDAKPVEFQEIMDDLTLIFKAGPSFETNMDGSKVGSAYLVHFIEPALESPGRSVPVRVTCTY